MIVLISSEEVKIPAQRLGTEMNSVISNECGESLHVTHNAVLYWYCCVLC